MTGRVSIARAGGRQELVFCGRISAGFGGRFFDRSVKIARAGRMIAHGGVLPRASCFSTASITATSCRFWSPSR